MKTFRIRVYTLVFCLAFLIVGCDGTVVPGVDPTSSITPFPSATVTPTLTPSPTPTSLPPVALLLAPPEAPPELVEAIRDEMARSVQDVGLRFQVRPSISSELIIDDNFQLVVALWPTQNLESLMSASADTKFLTIGISGLEVAPNLSMIGSEGERFDQQGFIAGYIAGLITPDWRAGVLGIWESPDGLTSREGFLNGVRFFCGLCLPTYPPFYEYPLYVELPEGSTTIEWQAAAEILINKSVETIFIVPGAGDEALLQFLAQSGINMIASMPPPEDIRERWVATTHFDVFQAFQDIWPDFLRGESGDLVPYPLLVSDINHELLSPGRYRLVEKTLLDLQEGYIFSGVEP